VWILLVQSRDSRNDYKKGTRRHRGLLEGNLSNFLDAFRDIEDVGTGQAALWVQFGGGTN
jgi:hypothetical protein